MDTVHMKVFAVYSIQEGALKGLSKKLLVNTGRFGQRGSPRVRSFSELCRKHQPNSNT